LLNERRMRTQLLLTCVAVAGCAKIHDLRTTAHSLTAPKAPGAASQPGAAAEPGAASVPGVPAAASVPTAATGGATYQPDDGDAKTNFGAAISICAGWKGRSPGELADSDYHDYVEKRDSAVSADPKITTWNTKYLGYVPSEMFPFCEKISGDYAGGVDADKKPMGDMCKRSTDVRLDSIINNYYPTFKKSGLSNGSAWFARKDLEAARWYMYFGQGFNPQGRGCAMNDRYKKAFAPIKAKFDQAEALVKEIETARGVRFEKVENGNHVVFIDVNSNKPVEYSDKM
jgi:hypothetical protein